MAYKTLRERRYQDLRLIGFLPFEARILSKVPRKTPYMRDIGTERAKEYSRWLKSGKSDKEWETHVLRVYRAKGWTRQGQKVKSASSVYAFLRARREAMLPQYPEYASPSRVREKRFRHVASDIEIQLRRMKRIDKVMDNWDD